MSENDSWGGLLRPLVWNGNSFSAVFKDEIKEDGRAGPMKDRGYIEITKHENTLTGTIDPKTATVLNVRGVSIVTTEWIPSNVPSRGPPAVFRQVMEFRNIGPLTKEDNGIIDARRSTIAPDVLKQHLVEMSNSAADLSSKYYPGTGDPKVCRVDLSVFFSR